jgi:hypothetical protein
MYTFRSNDIVILLGAGASVDAGIPHSASMIEKTENLIKNDLEWKNLEMLYYYIRSSIYYLHGIQGKFNYDVSYNIETLVNTLDELTKKQDHILYPFVGAWNPTLLEVAGNDFGYIKKLKEKILHELRDKWLQLEDDNVVEYYEGLVHFRTEYEQTLRVFSLNYDLCVETACKKHLSNNFVLELGFDDKKIWDWRRFTEYNSDEAPDIFLYKLHGSTDWQDTPYNQLSYKNPNLIPDDGDDGARIIFGTSYKLQYRDPFLFLTYEFRKWVLDSKMIICIGYGFGDEHINKIIQQALNQNSERRLLSISPFRVETDETRARKEQEVKVAKLLSCGNPNQIICREYTAKKFMQEFLNRKFLSEFFPDEGELFTELAS